MPNMTKEHIAEWFQSLQDRICQGLETLDGNVRFSEDIWKREDGGGGRTRTIKDGNLIEKGGVNFSAVHGPTPEKILSALRLENADFFATGVSIVLHPQNPWVPIIHMNVRYFEMSNGIWWFGGGIDLTPHIIIGDKASKFHQMLKKVCDNHSKEYYPEFKNWADDYFYLSHRKETRGIGGIFFDRLNGPMKEDKQRIFDFVKSVGGSFLPIYTEAVAELRNRSWSDEDLVWQGLRRGRYVEFNLVHDKGTKFGLDTDGRTESILVSMPPKAKWEYNHQTTNPIYQETLDKLKKGIDWIS